MEDGIPRELQHRHKTCCEKGGCHGRQACVKIVNGGLYFILDFILFFLFIFLFLFLEQLGLGLIGHTVTSVTS